MSNPHDTLWQSGNIRSSRAARAASPRLRCSNHFSTSSARTSGRSSNFAGSRTIRWPFPAWRGARPSATGRWRTPAAAAAKAEADKLRVEFEAKFNATPRRPEPRRQCRGRGGAALEASREDDGLRRLRDTERDSDPDAPDADAPEDDWDKLGAEDELPTFFEAMRPHLRRNQRGPGILGRGRLPGQEMGHLRGGGPRRAQGMRPRDPRGRGREGHLRRIRRRPFLGERQPPRGTLGQHEGKEPRPCSGPCRPRGSRPRRARRRREAPARQEASASPGAQRGGPPSRTPPAPPRRFRAGRPSSTGSGPLMRKNRREPGGSGSMSFLSRALKCSEAALIEAFIAMGLSAARRSRRPAGLRRDRGRVVVAQQGQPRGLWINAREKRRDEAAGRPGRSFRFRGARAPGNVFAAVRLLLKETKTGRRCRAGRAPGGRTRQAGRRTSRARSPRRASGSRKNRGRSRCLPSMRAKSSGST